MKALVLNLQRFDFVNEETGQRVQGGNLHYISDETDDNVNVSGYVVCKLFLTKEKIEELGLDKLKGSAYCDLDIAVSLSGYGKLKPALKSFKVLSPFEVSMLEKPVSK